MASFYLKHGQNKTLCLVHINILFLSLKFDAFRIASAPHQTDVSAVSDAVNTSYIVAIFIEFIITLKKN